MKHMRISSFYLTLSLAFLSFLSLFLLSQSPLYAQSSTTSENLTEIPKIYGGLQSQQSNTILLQDQKDKQGRASIHWIGFEMKANGGSRVFMKASAPLDYTQIEGGSDLNLVIEFNQSKLITRNDQREIDTTYFYSVVQSIKAKQKDKQTVFLQIQLREACDHKILIEGNFLYIDFPAPQKTPAVYSTDEAE
jgi:hypothetical protein